MRNILVILVVAFLPFSGFSQSIFDKYEDLDKVSAVVVNESMFKLLSKIEVDVEEPEAKDFMAIAKSIKNLKVFITEDKAIYADMKS